MCVYWNKLPGKKKTRQQIKWTDWLQKNTPTIAESTAHAYEIHPYKIYSK